MTVAQFIQQLRHLVMEHPDAANMEMMIAPHGNRAHQPIEKIHLGHHQNRVYVEGEK